MSNDEARQVVYNYFESKGWSRDRFGHLKSSAGSFRLKFQEQTFRREVKSDLGWVNLLTTSYKKQAEHILKKSV